MTARPHSRPKWFRHYLFPLLLLLGGIALLSNRDELLDVGRLIANMRPGFLAIAAIIQYLSYYAEAKTYEEIVALWNRKVNVSIMLERSVIERFIARSVPSLSLAGNVYVAKKFIDDGMRKDDAIQTVVIAAVNYYIAIFFFGVFSFIFLWTRHKLTPLELVFFVLFALFALFVYFIGIIGPRIGGRIGALYRGMVDKFTGAAHALFGQSGAGEGGRQERRENKAAAPPLTMPLAALWQIIRFAMESFSIYFLFLGFGTEVHIGIVTVGFSVATIFGTLSFFPGGLGQFEAAQIISYTSLGVPAQTAVAVTLVYRLLSFWLPMPIGAALYRRGEKKTAVTRS